MKKKQCIVLILVLTVVLNTTKLTCTLFLVHSSLLGGIGGEEGCISVLERFALFSRETFLTLKKQQQNVSIVKQMIWYNIINLIL